MEVRLARKLQEDSGYSAVGTGLVILQRGIGLQVGELRRQGGAGRARLGRIDLATLFSGAASGGRRAQQIMHIVSAEPGVVTAHWFVAPMGKAVADEEDVYRGLGGGSPDRQESRQHDGPSERGARPFESIIAHHCAPPLSDPSLNYCAFPAPEEAATYKTWLASLAWKASITSG